MPFLSCWAPVVGMEVWAALLRVSAGTQQLSLGWRIAWKGFSLRDTNTGVLSAGKTSESQLAEHHKIILVCSSRTLLKDKKKIKKKAAAEREQLHKSVVFSLLMSLVG